MNGVLSWFTCIMELQNSGRFPTLQRAAVKGALNSTFLVQHAEAIACCKLRRVPVICKVCKKLMCSIVNSDSI